MSATPLKAPSGAVGVFGATQLEASRGVITAACRHDVAAHAASAGLPSIVGGVLTLRAI